MSRIQTRYAIRIRIRIRIVTPRFRPFALGVANSFVIYRCAIRLGFGHSLRCDAVPLFVCVYLCSSSMGWNRLESSVGIVVVYINIYLCMRSSRQLIASRRSLTYYHQYLPLSPQPSPPFASLATRPAFNAAGAWQPDTTVAVVTSCQAAGRSQQLPMIYDGTI